MAWSFLPAVMGIGNSQSMDVISLGTCLLMYSGPWGIVVAAPGWMVQDAAFAGSWPFLAVSVLLWSGPRWRVSSSPTPPVHFGATLAGTCVVLLSPWVLKDPLSFWCGDQIG